MVSRETGERFVLVDNMLWILFELLVFKSPHLFLGGDAKVTENGGD